MCPSDYGILVHFTLVSTRMFVTLSQADNRRNNVVCVESKSENMM